MSAGQSKRVLLVDDDKRLLDSMRRNLHKSYELTTALGPEEGLDAMSAKGPFAVVVSDYQMPGMDGITLLTKVQERSPDTVRIMLTGNADLTTAIEAVNRGSLFRFLEKPCEPDAFKACLDAGLEQYRLSQAERVLLEQTLQGSIQVLADVLSLVNPLAFGRATRVRSYVSQIVATLNLDNGWQYETAALLSQIGCVAVPPDLLEKSYAGQTLTDDQRGVLAGQPEIGKDLLSNIPRLEEVAEIIAHQNHGRHGVEESPLPAGTKVPIGSRILAAAIDFDALVSRGTKKSKALETLRERKGIYHPKVLEALGQVELPGQNAAVRAAPIASLKVGMIIDQDVANEEGALVVTRGREVTPGLLARLRNYEQLGSIAGSIRVLVPCASKEAAHAPT